MLADGRFPVLYRPHPLIGVTSPAYAVADRAIREAIAAAGAPNRVIDAEEESLESTFARAAGSLSVPGSLMRACNLDCSFGLNPLMTELPRLTSWVAK